MGRLRPASLTGAALARGFVPMAGVLAASSLNVALARRDEWTRGVSVHVRPPMAGHGLAEAENGAPAGPSLVAGRSAVALTLASRALIVPALLVRNPRIVLLRGVPFSLRCARRSPPLRWRGLSGRYPPLHGHVFCTWRPTGQSRRQYVCWFFHCLLHRGRGGCPWTLRGWSPKCARSCRCTSRTSSLTEVSDTSR